MKIADLMRHDSIGTLFGWMWIIGCFSAVYFFVQSYMYQDASSWIPFLLALGIGVLGKKLLKDFEADKNG